MVKAGHLGSDALPKEAGVTKEKHRGVEFTVIGNNGSIKLSKAN